MPHCPSAVWLGHLVTYLPAVVVSSLWTGGRAGLPQIIKIWGSGMSVAPGRNNMLFVWREGCDELWLRELGDREDLRSFHRKIWRWNWTAQRILAGDLRLLVYVPGGRAPGLGSSLAICHHHHPSMAPKYSSGSSSGFTISQVSSKKLVVEDVWMRVWVAPYLMDVLWKLLCRHCIPVYLEKI